jgi:ankyrin repeat protein
MRSTLIRRSFAVILLACIGFVNRRVTATGSLFEAIRSNDIAAVRPLVAEGADVNARDDTGATPLMYAALYVGPEFLTLLIDHGASVNAANTYGATPLMWAVTTPANVRVLVNRGADVNARGGDGVTALVAAGRFGNVESMRILMAAGADLKARDTRTNLLTGAYFGATLDAREVLKEAGVTVESAADLKGAVLNRNRGDIQTLRRLLAAGVDPNEAVPLNTLSLPTFFLAGRDGQVDVMRALVAAGVNPNVTGPRGWTALMLASSGDAPSVEAMQYLLDLGANVNVKDEDGRTALDWALTRGRTNASAFLESKGGTPNEPLAASPTQVTTTRTAVDAVTRAVARLQPAGPAFNNRAKCNSCHNQNIPGIAITGAQRRGLTIDERLAGHSMIATNRQWRNRREAVLLGDFLGGGFQPNTEYTLLEMAEDHMPSSPNSDAIVRGLASRQSRDGSWPVATDIRPPLTGSTISSTALAIRALREYAPPGLHQEMNARVERAIAFIRGATPQDTQDQAFKLLAMAWTAASGDEIARQRGALIALQRTDGGWAQLPPMASDAYATGQALYALHAAGVSITDEVYRKGIDYLLRTQLEDGTWFVQTRAFGFQTYFETGFPHGRSQFISTVATSWASIALMYTLDAGRSVTVGNARRIER